MVTPKDIKESIIDKPIIQELIKKIDEELLKEDKIKDAICGKVVIKIPERFPQYVISMVMRLYGEVGWLKIEADSYNYQTSRYNMADPFSHDEFDTGTKFIFYM